MYARGKWEQRAAKENGTARASRLPGVQAFALVQKLPATQRGSRDEFPRA
jgi:hypothetical protein